MHLRLTVLRPAGRSTSLRENRMSFGTLSQLSMRTSDEDARREERRQLQEKERKTSAWTVAASDLENGVRQRAKARMQFQS